jgi:DNA-binding transcriptional MerR regulator
MTLNDGTFLYKEDMVKDYLRSLGFDIDELADILTEDERKDAACLEEMLDNQERELDGIYCNLRDYKEELEELCNKLASGKGGTKVDYSRKIKYQFDCSFGHMV